MLMVLHDELGLDGYLCSHFWWTVMPKIGSSRSVCKCRLVEQPTLPVALSTPWHQNGYLCTAVYWPQAMMLRDYLVPRIITASKMCIFNKRCWYLCSRVMACVILATQHGIRLILLHVSKLVTLLLHMRGESETFLKSVAHWLLINKCLNRFLLGTFSQ